MGKIKLLIQTIIRADEAYTGEGMMLALYFISLLFIVFYVREKKKTDSILVPQVLCIWLLYIGVPFISVFIKKMEFFDGRLFWILFTPIITAVGLTDFVFGIKDKWKQLAALLLLIPIIFYSGRFAISNDTYKKAENQYRLPQSVIDITDYVTNEKEDPCIVVPYTISHPFRQYSTKVKLLYGEDATSGRIMGAEAVNILICNQMEKTIPDLNRISLYKSKGDFDADYILFDTVYTSFCDNGDINIYNYEKDKRYVGDRTPDVDYDGLRPITVVDENDPHWDLSAYDLSYCGRFGQYVLYSFDS